jgi:acetyltransferase-like isoleucine patch superfamily enzyme
MEYGKNTIGESPTIFEGVLIGFPSRARMGTRGFRGASIGKQAVLRPGTVIYCDVIIGDYFQTGHNVLVREETTIGDHVAIGTSTIIEGRTSIGNHVNLQSMVYIPTDTIIEDSVFIGPNTVLTNDPYPPHGGVDLRGPVIRRGASIGANATILPGVEIGERALVGAGAIVTRDVPPGMLAIGAPARWKDLPDVAKKEKQ